MSRRPYAAAVVGATLCWLALPAHGQEITDPELQTYIDAASAVPHYDSLSALELTALLLEARAFIGADALAMQVAADNTVQTSGRPREAVISGSAVGNQGITAVNQSSGEANNQGNAVAIAVVGPGTPSLRAVDANATQVMTRNSVTTAASLETRIEDSFNGVSGIAQVNQAAGHVNNQLNLFALALGEAAGPAGAPMADAQLGQIGSEEDSALSDTGAEKHITIANSFNGFDGVAQVNISAGNLNQVGNVLGVSVRATP